jgi:hypothetical protein
MRGRISVRAFSAGDHLATAMVTDQPQDITSSTFRIYISRRLNTNYKGVSATGLHTCVLQLHTRPAYTTPSPSESEQLLSAATVVYRGPLPSSDVGRKGHSFSARART